MKKAFKPFARIEKASQIYRKKTLGVNDNLDIKHDSDLIENVEEYWATAQSVIGDSTITSTENTSASDQSDTLFNIDNIRKSIKNNGEEIYRKSIKENIKENKNNEMNFENVTNSSKINKKKEEIGNVGTKIDLVKLEEKLIQEGKLKPDTNTIPSNLESFSINNGVDMDYDDPVSAVNTCFEDLKAVNTSFEDLKAANTSFEDLKAVNTSFEDLKAINSLDSQQIIDSTVLHLDESSMPNNTVNEINSINKLKAKPVPTKIKNYKFKKGKIVGDSHNPVNFEVQMIQSYKKLNMVKPMVCSNTINTAIMNLDYLAYIENFISENSLSIYLVKGKIELCVNGQTKILSKESVTVVEKGSTYSLNCISKAGSRLFLTYVLE